MRGQKRIQNKGTYLFSGTAADSPLLVTLDLMAAQQSKSTERTKAAAKQLLDYIAFQEDPVLT